MTDTSCTPEKGEESLYNRYVTPLCNAVDVRSNTNQQIS